MNDFIKLQQKFITQIDNAKNTDRILHANLIEGDNSIIIDKAINYFLASLFNSDDYDNIINQNSASIIMYDLDSDKFKKDDAILIQKQFSTTPLEGTKQVYIIKNIDKANVVVMNSLLKFLEEPTQDVYAILTTTNSEKVLDTIVSRTARYTLLSNDVETLKQHFYTSFDKIDVDLACAITKNEVRIREILESNILKEYQVVIPKIFDAIKTNSSFPVFYEALNNKEKPALKVFFELFYLVLTNKKIQELLNLSQANQELIFNTLSYSQALDEVISAKVALETNMNTGLLIDQFSIKIEEYLV